MVMDWPIKAGSGWYSTRACPQILQVGWGLHLILSSFFLHVSPLCVTVNIVGPSHPDLVLHSLYLVHGCPSWSERHSKKRTVDGSTQCHLSSAWCARLHANDYARLCLCISTNLHRYIMCLSILHMHILEYCVFWKYLTNIPHHWRFCTIYWKILALTQGVVFGFWVGFQSSVRSKWWMAPEIGVIRTLRRRVVGVKLREADW